MKVLFVTHNDVSHEPLGMMYVSAALKKAGHEAVACEEREVIDQIKSLRPDFAAFQVITGDEDKWKGVALKVKKQFPQVKTIFGGPHFLYFQEGHLEGVDMILRGEAERSIIDAVEGRPWTDLAAEDDIDKLPFADRALFYNRNFPLIHHNVIRNFISARGCPFRCTYCYNSNEGWRKMMRGKKKIRIHSPDYVVDEVTAVFKNWGGTLVSFQDDVFGMSLEWLERFTRLYQRVRTPFFMQLRPCMISEERIRLLKMANVHIVNFAIESAVEETRARVLDRFESNERIALGVRLLHKYGIRFRMQNMIGLPIADPLGDALKTLKFNMKCKPTLSWCSLLQAYPGTKIADYVLKAGLVKSEADLIPHIKGTFFDTCSLPLKDREKLGRLHKYWSAVVRWPWLYPVVRVLININLGGRLERWFFHKSKQHINKKEYWRIV